MRFRILTALAAALLAQQATAQQRTLDNPAAAFGARESVRDVDISPDGRSLIYLAAGQGRSTSLYAVDLETAAARLVSYSSGDPIAYNWCRFGSNDRLACGIGRQMIGIDIDGGDPVALGFVLDVIDWMPGEEGKILLTKSYYNGLALELVDLETGRGRHQDGAEGIFSQFITDGYGELRVAGGVRTRGATGMMSDAIRFHYQRPNSDRWESLSVYSMSERTGFYPIAVDRESNVAYGFDRLDGRLAIFTTSLDGALTRETVFAHPAVDVDEVVRIGRRGRVIGATFAEDQRLTEYFDEEYRALAASLARALPGLPLVRFAGASDDESRLLIWAGSDADPGQYFVYDKTTRALNEIMVARPQLEGVALAQVRPIRYQAADGTTIPGYLTMPPGRENARGLPAIVMPHGGPEARDEWGFDWLAQYFAHQGYAVLQPNFRGSAGYGDDWFVENGFQSWQTAIGDVNSGGRWLIAEGIADPEQIGIVGWSYGGYAALQSGVLDPELFKAVVAVAPVTDLDLLRDDARNYTHYRNLREFIGDGPHIRAGSPARNADRITAPVLLVHGEDDGSVDIGHARLMRARLEAAGKRVEYIEFEGLGHQLDDAAARASLLERSDAFLREAFGLPALARAPTALANEDASPQQTPGPVFPGAVTPDGAVGADDDGGGAE